MLAGLARKDQVGDARSDSGLWSTAGGKQLTLRDLLELEEELYSEIINIYRRPQELFNRTESYRHWYAVHKEEEAASAAAAGAKRGVRHAIEDKGAVTKEGGLRRRIAKQAS